jgi:tricorn protease
MITFAYHDDIWVANADGSNARRLTTHVAREINPRFSPDGNWVAFSSNRMGNYDVFVVPVTGGEPRQLTWHSANDEVQYWTPDGSGIVFRRVAARTRGVRRCTSCMSTAVCRAHDHGQCIGRHDQPGRAHGRVQPQRLPLQPQGLPRQQQRRRLRAGSATRESASSRTRTSGSTATFVHDAHPMWGADGMIYYASDRSGVFNIWRIDPQGGAPVQVTRHDGLGIRFPSISPDGRTIIYENDYELWSVDVPASGGAAPAHIP